MTESMVTEEDREIARRWLSDGQINVDQMGRAAVLVAIRQEYRAAKAAERERCARVAEEFGRPYALKTSTGAMMFRAVTDKIAAAIRAME